MELGRLKAHPNCQWATWHGYRFQVKKRGESPMFIGVKGATKKIKVDDVPGLQQLLHAGTSSFLEDLDAPDDSDENLGEVLGVDEMPGGDASGSQDVYGVPSEDAHQPGGDAAQNAMSIPDEDEGADPGNPHVVAAPMAQPRLEEAM